MAKIGFLHTSPVHVPTFAALMKPALAEDEILYRVDEQLLAYAMEHGSDSHVVERVDGYLRDLQARGCEEVVCTCSTLGPIAEEMQLDGMRISRIDRPMAADAVRRGHVILMVAAIRSTLLPTRELILDESEKQRKPIQIVDLIVESAWPHFLAGDLEAYYQTIAQEIEAFLSDKTRCNAKLNPDVIVIAQASMAPAADLLNHLDQPVLTSPKLCAEAVINNLSN